MLKTAASTTTTRGHGSPAGRRRRRAATLAATTTCVGMVIFAPPAWAEPGEVYLASTSAAGVKSTGASRLAAMSADGATVAFVSSATNLHPADTDEIQDIYVKNLATGDLVLASTTGAGVKGDRESFDPSLSADGTLVAFTSNASNLDPGDPNSSNDVYVKNLATGDLVLASTSDTGVRGNGASYEATLSADGTTVAFISLANNLDPADTDRNPDVYVKDLSTGVIVLASASSTGRQGNGSSYGPSLSADGATVAFTSSATNLHRDDTDANADVYVKDLTTGDIVLASTSGAGTKGNGPSFDPSLSGDSTAVAFETFATNLDPADTDIFGDVYIKSLTTGAIVLASTSVTGEKGIRESFDASLSADGTQVAFTSNAKNLHPDDTNNEPDIYVKDVPGGGIVLASTNARGGKGNHPSENASLAAEGTRVAFDSNSINLHPDDQDSLTDVFVKDLVPPGGELPTVSIRDYAVTEGDAGIRYAVFPVRLSAPSTTTVTVDYATANGTATAGSDYRARSGTLSFAPGQMRMFVVIPVLGDEIVEPDETFTVTLSNPTGATIADGQAVGTIRNDD